MKFESSFIGKINQQIRFIEKYCFSFSYSCNILINILNIIFNPFIVHMNINYLFLCKYFDMNLFNRLLYIYKLGISKRYQKKSCKALIIHVNNVSLHLIGKVYKNAQEQYQNQI